MTQKELKDGKVLKFRNDDYEEVMEASWSDHLGRYLIWFNGQIIKDPKTFRAFKSNLDLLVNRHNLTEVLPDIERVLKALDNNDDFKRLDSEEDYCDETRSRVSRIDDEVDFDLDDDIYITVKVYADGKVTGDGGDYFNPPSWDVEWGELEYDELRVYIENDEVKLDAEQEAKVWEKIKENISFE